MGISSSLSYPSSFIIICFCRGCFFPHCHTHRQACGEERKKVGVYYHFPSFADSFSPPGTWYTLLRSFLTLPLILLRALSTLQITNCRIDIDWVGLTHGQTKAKIRFPSSYQVIHTHPSNTREMMTHPSCQTGQTKGTAVWFFTSFLLLLRAKNSLARDTNGHRRSGRFAGRNYYRCCCCLYYPRRQDSG